MSNVRKKLRRTPDPERLEITSSEFLHYFISIGYSFEHVFETLKSFFTEKLL